MKDGRIIHYIPLESEQVPNVMRSAGPFECNDIVNINAMQGSCHVFVRYIYCAYQYAMT